MKIKYTCCICGNTIDKTKDGVTVTVGALDKRKKATQELYAHLNCFEKALGDPNDLYIKHLL